MAVKAKLAIKFVFLLLANLLADLAQIEAAAPTIVGVMAALTAASGNNPTVVRIAGLVTAALAAGAIVLVKGRWARDELGALMVKLGILPPAPPSA